MKNIDQIKIFVIIIVFLSFTFFLKSQNEASTPNSNTTESDINVEATMQGPDQTPKSKLNYASFIKIQLDTNGTATIPVNPPTIYTGRTKNSILTERKNNIKKYFDLPNYEPNQNIFGQIQDNANWISSYGAFCDFSNISKRTTGTSEESIFLNNPLGLIMIEMPYYSYTNNKNCTSSEYLTPTKFIIDKEKITAYYNLSAFQNKLKPEALKYSIYILKPINAKDLGYEWGYAEAKGLGFNGENSIENSPYQFQDFIHLGSSCDVEGGCNNGSPFQEKLTMYIDNFPAEINFKLWKEKPHSKDLAADLIYKIILN